MPVEMPDPFAALLVRCFNRDPQKRPSMAELASALGSEPLTYVAPQRSVTDVDIARAQAAPWLHSATIYGREPLT